MQRHCFFIVSIFLFLFINVSVFAADSDDLSALKKQLDDLRLEYLGRITELESRLQQAEDQAAEAKQQARSAQSAANTAVAASSSASGVSTSSANAFNPAISVTLDAKYREFSRDVTDTIPGFAIGEEGGGGDEGFSLDESEVNFSANVDDKFYGSLTVALVEEDGETSVELEEAFMQTLGLSAGFIVKAGRFFSNVGYLNQFHAHADDFEDRPLPYRAFLNNQFTDDGIQISWVAPTSLFLELGTELFRGNGFPAGGSDGEGFDNWSVFGHVGGDVGINNSWRAGLSYLSSNAHERETGEGDLFTGDSDLLIADFVWKWAPNGNADNRNFKLQGEYFWRDEDGLFTPDGGSALDYGENQDGWYLQGIYQFMPQWRAGVRYARLHANDPGAAFAGTVLDDHGHDPHDTSVMLDWSPSEFSRLRLQYNMDKTQLDRDDQILLQYIMSIGSHGAHQF